jgi:hypothetical protein
MGHEGTKAQGIKVKKFGVLVAKNKNPPRVETDSVILR